MLPSSVPENFTSIAIQKYVFITLLLLAVQACLKLFFLHKLLWLYVRKACCVLAFLYIVFCHFPILYYPWLFAAEILRRKIVKWLFFCLKIVIWIGSEVPVEDKCSWKVYFKFKHKQLHYTFDIVMETSQSDHSKGLLECFIY